MKKMCLLLIVQMAVFTAFAQQNIPPNVNRPEPVYPLKDKQAYQEYTIRLIPAMPFPGSKGSYGFDILKDKKIVIHQFQSPLAFSLTGVQKKEDAYKIAQWMIEEFKKTGHWQTQMPPHIAHQLKIGAN